MISITSAAPWLLSLCSSQQNKRRELEVAYPCMTEIEGLPLLLTGLMLASMQNILSGEIPESKLCLAKEGSAEC